MLGDIVPKSIPLTLACGNYEIVRSLLEDTVKPDGIDLTILTDMDSTTRHWRFLREGHLMRGILEHEYGVPHKSVHWVAELDEDVDFVPPPDLKITRLPHDKSVENMLAEGEVDALIHSDIIKPIEVGDPRVARLWPDYKAEEIRFWKKTQIFPIMHVMGIRQEIVDRHPWVPVNLFHAFEKSKAIAMRRMDNPRIVPLAWYLEAWNEQQSIIGSDPWEYGLSERNRHNVNTIAGYSHNQGLTTKKWTADDLFVSVFQGRKRGDEWRI